MSDRRTTRLFFLEMIFALLTFARRATEVAL
jgi:hypothetical protein